MTLSIIISTFASVGRSVDHQLSQWMNRRTGATRIRSMYRLEPVADAIQRRAGRDADHRLLALQRLLPHLATDVLPHRDPARRIDRVLGGGILDAQKEVVGEHRLPQPRGQRRIELLEPVLVLRFRTREKQRCTLDAESLHVDRVDEVLCRRQGDFQPFPGVEVVRQHLVDHFHLETRFLMAELAYQPFSAAGHVNRAWPGGHAEIPLREFGLFVDADDELQRLDRHPLLGELVLDVRGSHSRSAQIQAPLQELIPQDNAIVRHCYVCRRRIARIRHSYQREKNQR